MSKKPTLTEYIANDIIDTQSTETWEKDGVAEILLTAMQDSNLEFEFDDYEYFMLMEELNKLFKEKLNIEEAIEKEVEEREDNYREYIEARDGYLRQINNR